MIEVCNFYFWKSVLINILKANKQTKKKQYIKSIYMYVMYIVNKNPIENWSRENGKDFFFFLLFY